MSIISEELFIKLYLDEDVSSIVATALCNRGFEVTTAHQIGNLELSDVEQLEFAVSKERAILTFNAPDYINLHREYTSQGKKHWGIIVSDQVPVKQIIKRTAKLLNNISREEMKNQLLYLQAFR